jgi:hypothetical protein
MVNFPLKFINQPSYRYSCYCAENGFLLVFILGIYSFPLDSRVPPMIFLTSKRNSIPIFHYPFSYHFIFSHLDFPLRCLFSMPAAAAAESTDRCLAIHFGFLIVIFSLRWNWDYYYRHHRHSRVIRCCLLKDLLFIQSHHYLERFGAWYQINLPRWRYYEYLFEH